MNNARLTAPASPEGPRRLIHGMSKAELESCFLELGLPKYRAGQIWQWLYQRLVSEWPQMTNLSLALRQQLAEQFILDSAVAQEIHGEPGATRKMLARFPDGERVEAVLIPAADRQTVCVSSQAGCRYKCAFCASGQAGFRRQLEAGEIVGEVLLAARLIGARPSNVVFMGIGEPFDNYDEVLRAIRILNDGDGLNIGARRMTISTCGVIPGIQRLAGEGLQVEMSVSLHAPNDELRSRLMPVNRRYPLAQLLAACQEYFAATKRLITFEYTLVRGLNDRPEHARELARILGGFPCRVNLIPLSPVAEFQGEAAAPETADMFIETLERAGVNATFRSSKGSAIQAACGQLRFRKQGTEEDSTQESGNRIQ